MGRFFAFLRMPALIPLTPKEKTTASLLIGVLVFLMVLIFRPAQANPLPLPENLVAAAAYGFISFLISLLSQLFLQNSFMKRGCSRLRLLAWLGINMLAIGTVNALASVIVFRNPPSLGMYFQVLGGTVATGIIILALLLLWQWNSKLRGILRRNLVLGGEEISIPAGGIDWTLSKNRILYVKALENYIDLFYRDKNDRIAHRLIRSTMKNVEAVLKQHREFIRCHRSYIVNTDRAGKLVRAAGGLALQIEGIEQLIPVSRGHKGSLKALLRTL
jgi:hypothetical protein